MLDEHEYARLRALHEAILRAGKSAEPEPRDDWSRYVAELWKPVVDEYERMTGLRVTNAGIAMHHRLAAFGPPCRVCGKPLRTPRAAVCAACGSARSPHGTSR